MLDASEEDDGRSSSSGGADRVPPGHCWVLADNEALQPPDVIDSRSFGYLDMRLIIGRAIYKVRACVHACVRACVRVCMCVAGAVDVHAALSDHV
jgi:hypothetical protein